MLTFANVDPSQIKRANVGAVVINEEQKFLYCQRSAVKKFLPHTWHFPGGKIEVGESFEQALTREINEELSLNVLETKQLPLSHIYNVDGDIHETFFLLTKVVGKIALDFENDAYQFLAITDLQNYLQESVLKLNLAICAEAMKSPLISYNLS